jgi:hypothetical protein
LRFSYDCCVKRGECWILLLGCWLSACATPTLTADGQWVFSAGKPGAVVLTANGVEFRDNSAVPRPKPRSDPFEPWEAPTGFLVPTSGRFTKLAPRYQIAGPGLSMEVRASDRWVPSWGGEVFLMVHISNPVQPKRKAHSLVVVMDGDSEDQRSLLHTALATLRSSDRLALVDAHGAQVLVPPISHAFGSMIRAAAEKRVQERSKKARRRLLGALQTANQLLAQEPSGNIRQLIIISDGGGIGNDGQAIRSQVGRILKTGVKVSAVTSRALPDETIRVFGYKKFVQVSLNNQQEAMDTLVFPASPVALTTMELHVSGVPAPVHVLNASEGVAYSTLEEDVIPLTNLHQGEQKSVMIRLVAPVWVPRERMELQVDISYQWRGELYQQSIAVPLRYSDRLAQLADDRHADVLAQASALSVLGLMPNDAFGGRRALQNLLKIEASSLEQLANERSRPPLRAQAELLHSLGWGFSDSKR